MGLLAAALTGGSLLMLLAASPASAQTAPPPAPGVTPSTAVVGSDLLLLYTSTNGSVWMKNLTTGQFTPAGGHLVGAPSAIADGASVIVFGRGTDNHLWWNSCNLFNLCGKWLPLSGTLTSAPGAVLGPNAADYSVYVRGTNGAVWARDRSASGWGPWHSLGGQVLAGTAPAAAYTGGTYVMVTGTNREMYLEKVGVTAFKPVGGQTTATPALTAVPGALVGFARGTSNDGFYHRFLSSSPGWHPMGGRLTSGLAASSPSGLARTYTFGLGPDNQVYEDAGTWTKYPPALSGWSKVTG
jgi:hypothetical protein